MKNLFCRELLTQHYPLLPLTTLKKKWNTDCVNTQTLSGYPVHLFPELKKLDGNYCVRPDQLHFLHGNKHPYTGKRLFTTIPWKQTMPVTQEFNTALCPLHERFKSKEKEYMFLASPYPIRSVDDLPTEIEISLRNEVHYTLRKPILFSTIRPSYIYSMYYYMVRIDLSGKKKIVYQIPKKKILKLYPMYKKEPSQNLYDKISDKELKKELESYFTYESTTFSDKTLELLRQVKMRLPEPLFAFRGIFIHNLKELETAKLDKITTGDTIQIDSRGRPVSWSTDSCLSQYFATHTPARKMLGDSPLQFGIVYSTILKPEQIAIDTRLISRRYFKSELYPYDQQEVITFPFDKDGKMMTFPCKIERLFLVDRRHHRITIVHSFQKVIPFLLKK
jgi:hypothetical protein